MTKKHAREAEEEHATKKQTVEKTNVDVEVKLAETISERQEGDITHFDCDLASVKVQISTTTPQGLQLAHQLHKTVQNEANIDAVKNFIPQAVPMLLAGVPLVDIFRQMKASSPLLEEALRESTPVLETELIRIQPLMEPVRALIMELIEHQASWTSILLLPQRLMALMSHLKTLNESFCHLFVIRNLVPLVNQVWEAWCKISATNAV